MVSSANVPIFAFTKQLRMSLIDIKNKSGLRVQPCGTPHWIESGFVFKIAFEPLEGNTTDSMSV